LSRSKIYPESKIEIKGFAARHMDKIIDILSLWRFERFMNKTINELNIQKSEFILDLGSGTGRNASLMRKHIGSDGYLMGMDISYTMGRQFQHYAKKNKNMEFQCERIDLPFKQDMLFDRIFISFVLHGFPQSVRIQVIKNALQNLKPGGVFCILDYSEFSLENLPLYLKLPFKWIEGEHTFNFISYDWKKILLEHGFSEVGEVKLWKDYIRMITAIKPLV